MNRTVADALLPNKFKSAREKQQPQKTMSAQKKRGLK